MHGTMPPFPRGASLIQDIQGHFIHHHLLRSRLQASTELMRTLQSEGHLLGLDGFDPFTLQTSAGFQLSV